MNERTRTTDHAGDRVVELLTLRSVEGLTHAEQRELDDAMNSMSGEERLSWDRTMAAVELAAIPEFVEQPLSDALRERLMNAATRISDNASGMTGSAVLGRVGGDRGVAAASNGPARGIPAGQRAQGGRWFTIGGWAAAAASLLILGSIVLNRPSAGGPGGGSVLAADARQREVVDRAPDVVRIAFAPGIDELKGVTGEVVWSDERQAGYMKFAGLAVNDPKQMQYQLWIVDPARDKHPVDGGVFDVTSAGEVLVPIRRALAVKSPAAFAITREKPGGVVVSAGPLVLVAKGG
jgi:hypothetical protein